MATLNSQDLYVIVLYSKSRPHMVAAQSRPVVITIFTQSVRLSQNFKIKR